MQLCLKPSRMQVGRSISLVLQMMGVFEHIKKDILNGIPNLKDDIITVGGLAIQVLFFFQNAPNFTKLSTFIDNTDPMIEFKPHGDDVRMNIGRLKPGGKKIIPEYKKNTPFYLCVTFVGYCSGIVELFSAKEVKRRNQDDITSYGSNTDFARSDPFTTCAQSTISHKHMDNLMDYTYSEELCPPSFGINNYNLVPYQNANPYTNSYPIPFLKVYPNVIFHPKTPICIIGSFYPGYSYMVRFYKDTQEIFYCTRNCQDSEQLCWVPSLSLGKYRIVVDEFACGLDLVVQCSEEQKGESGSRDTVICNQLTGKFIWD